MVEIRVEKHDIVISIEKIKKIGMYSPLLCKINVVYSVGSGRLWKHVNVNKQEQCYYSGCTNKNDYMWM